MYLHDCNGRLVEKNHLEKDDVLQRNTQAGNITTNIKVKVNFTLPALSTTNVVMWKCHVHDSAKGRHNIILVQYLLKRLGLNLKLSEHVLKADSLPFKWSTTPIVDLVTYIFKDLNTEKITPE